MIRGVSGRGMNGLAHWAACLPVSAPPARWRVGIPGITAANGTYVPSHERVVAYDGVTPMRVLARGGGDYWQREAHTRLVASHRHWDAIPLADRALHVLAVATELQDEADRAVSFTKATRWWSRGDDLLARSGKACPNPTWTLLNAPRLHIPDDIA